MKAIVLDGYFQGLIMEYDGNPNLFLMKPTSITSCYCYSDYDPEISESPFERLHYKIAARGLDGTLLYSLNGDLFDPLTKKRDWVIDKRKHPYHKDEPVYFTCREEGAFK